MLNKTSIYTTRNRLVEENGSVTYYNAVIDTNYCLILIEEAELNEGRPASVLLEPIINSLCDKYLINKASVITILRLNGVDYFVRFSRIVNFKLRFPSVEKKPLGAGLVDEVLRKN